MAKRGKQSALAAVGQKGTRRAVAPEIAINNTPNSLSGQKRSSPKRTSSGKKTYPLKSSSEKKMTPSKSCSVKKNTPSKTSTGKKSAQSKISGASASDTKKRKERFSDGNTSSKKKKVTVPSSAVPSNTEDDDVIELGDGSQVMASEVQIVEVAERSQVYEADQPFRPIIRVDDAKVQAHKRLFYEQLEGHYFNLKTFSLMTRRDINAAITLIRNKDAYQYKSAHHYKVMKEICCDEGRG
jgi:hypothetical protein